MGHEVEKSGAPGDVSAAQPSFAVRALVSAVSFLIVSGLVSQGLKRGFFSSEEGAQARARRLEPAATLALAPLPVQLPVVARPGKDAAGYPRDYVDRVALRSLLGRAKYIELTQYFEKFQADFEADFHNEYLLNDAAEAFESADPALGEKLEDWIRATPDSFAPYLARGVHRFTVGAVSRGEKVSKDTPGDDFRAMKDAFLTALDDLHHVLESKPRAMPALRYELRIALMDATHRMLFKPLAKRAFSLCPGCFIARVTYQAGNQPRWGGSYDAMEAAAREASPALNPLFKQLAGYADLDRASGAIHQKNLDAALAFVERACALGDNADFLDMKADILSRKNEFAQALSAANRALELRPQRPSLLYSRARLASLAPSKDWHSAYLDLSMALRLDASDSDARGLVPYIAKGLAAAGWEAHLAGNEGDAIRWLEEAAVHRPSAELEQQRVQVLTAGFHGTDAEIAALEQRANADRHDFYAHARLDYALSKRGEWDRIAALWHAYLKENPSDGRALLELGGTLMHQGRVEQARTAATRACELGVSKGCVIIKHL